MRRSTASRSSGTASAPWPRLRPPAGGSGAAERPTTRPATPNWRSCGGLPPGTLVDGECVAFDATGVPDLALLLQRNGLTNPWKIGQAWRWCALRYVLFDLLYYGGRCLMREPLSLRRAALADACAMLDAPEVVVFSTGLVGAGKAFFAAAVAQGHEGVLAKHLASPYRPGRRSAAWRKIKPRKDSYQTPLR